jgi:hypothetical protein
MVRFVKSLLMLAMLPASMCFSTSLAGSSLALRASGAAATNLRKSSSTQLQVWLHCADDQVKSCDLLLELGLFSIQHKIDVLSTGHWRTIIDHAFDLDQTPAVVCRWPMHPSRLL